MINSKIEWTDHTFNPWWGCIKVSPGCKNCYAETLDNRYHHDNRHWGPGSTRKPMSEKYWNEPLKWNKEAEQSGMPSKVFCASMADVFEGHPDTIPHLYRLFDLIEQTPFLIWQLLTKRPENIMRLVPDWWLNVGFPKNVWIGTSIENQTAVRERLVHLSEVPAIVRFLSIEPLLGPIDLGRVFMICKYWHHIEGNPYEYGKYWWKKQAIVLSGWKNPIQWVIVGGESGHGARPMHPDWVRSVRDQCAAADIPFFFKQWGEWGLGFECVEQTRGIESGLQFFPELNRTFQKVGKKAAGRLLDGKEYSEFPK